MLSNALSHHSPSIFLSLYHCRRSFLLTLLVLAMKNAWSRSLCTGVCGCLLQHIYFTVLMIIKVRIYAFLFSHSNQTFGSWSRLEKCLDLLLLTTAEFFKSPFSLAKRNVTRGRALTLSSAQSKKTNVIGGKLFTSRG